MLRRLPPLTAICLLAISPAVLGACSDPEPDPSPLPPPDQRAPCTEHDPLKHAYFGDLHAHTGFSFDAWAYENHHRPADVYRFAKGEPIELPPLDPSGQGTRTVQLSRPLDFAAVSDHSEFLGEIALCTVPGTAAYDSETCRTLRDDPESGVVNFGAQTIVPAPKRFDLCGGGDPSCILTATAERWQEIQDAAEEAYDRSPSCGFVSFVGYEYTATPGISNNHRNVIFAGRNVPALPTTYFEAQTAWELWGELARTCLDAGTGCDVITVAHNTNLSNGTMYQPGYPGATSTDDERAQAALRARMEPVVEIFQHKGTSECRNGFADGSTAPDPLCDVEQQWPSTALDCGDGTGAGGMRLMGCVSRLDFVRNIFKAGLAEQTRLGVNPFRMGIVGSTDTHNSIAGQVDEDDFPGHVGTVDDTAVERLGAGNATHDALLNNPGGLAVVWAEERSREAIFAALRRGETYATSGPRIELRLFGGWDYTGDLCAEPDWLPRAYAGGVPMGGELPAGSTGSGPRLLVWAKAAPAAPGHFGALLQRIQLVKGWVTPDGAWHERVLDIAGSGEDATPVDEGTCEPAGPGDEQLCAVWQDVDFDPASPAFYYARAVESPSCRWSTWDCLRLPEAERPAACTDPTVPRTTQEMAWSSPVWYSPAP